ncbi:MAG: hypothetical protein ACMV14_04680, partial [Prevotella sp.]
MEYGFSRIGEIEIVVNACVIKFIAITLCFFEYRFLVYCNPASFICYLSAEYKRNIILINVLCLLI